MLGRRRDAAVALPHDRAALVARPLAARAGAGAGAALAAAPLSETPTPSVAASGAQIVDSCKK